MDVDSGRRASLKMSPSRIKSFELDSKDTHETTKIPAKRSFDVAFLMLPDEKLKRKLEASSIEKESLNYPLTELSVRSDLMNRYSSINKVMNNTRALCDSEYAMKAHKEHLLSNVRYLNSVSSPEKADDIERSEAPRSAFSKVSQMLSVDSPLPPISPDQLSCSSSSPPISYSPPSSSFRPNYNHLITSGAFHAIDQSGFNIPDKYKHFMYRTNSNHGLNNNIEPNNAQAFKFGSPDQRNPVFLSQPDQFMRNPAAAILSSLLPTTLGALSLPAQNVCAKCNISFRMTSDLVYHMRSHHKNENTQDPNRRKREEKLKCPVCSESFRERHHLTRHMTAHQDKEGDLLDHEIAEYHSRRKNWSNTNQCVR